ncbi:MAG: FtsW/RodA/SpoVE family cell cycle protein [Bacteroidaceae bacterium]|nr:FtsW/RodA/SpoVE family cell cycle protein [Bacteroidaceae bacterium]
MGETGSRYIKGRPILWIIVAALCLISVIEVFSATSRMTFGGNQNYLMPVLKHVIHLILGLGIMYFCHRLHYKYFKIIPYILLPLSAAALVYLLVQSHINGSADRWIALPGFTLQPSELAKLGIVTAVAGMLAKMDENDALSQSRTFWRILMLTAIFVGMILPENLSTALLISAVVFFMLIVGRIRTRYLLGLSFTAAGVMGIMLGIMLLVPPQTIRDSHLPKRFVTWQARVLDFMDGTDNELSAKQYVRQVVRDKPQETHANIAIATSNIFGKGPGNSVERDFLQEASCDFIYAIIIEELGLIGALIVLGLYLLLMLKSSGVAARCGIHRYPKFLTLGITLMITLQALTNMSVAVGFIPVTGQPLPFISTGGSSILATGVYFGMLISISWSADDEYMQTMSETKTDNGNEAD